MSHVNKSRHIITYEYVMSPLNECPACERCECVMSHMWMSHVTHVNESCHTCEWVMSHIWMSHVTYMNESCHTYEWVMSHIWMSHVTHTNESCHTYEWVMSHIYMIQVTRANKSVHAYESHLKWESWTRIPVCVFVCSSPAPGYIKESCHTCEWAMPHI